MLCKLALRNARRSFKDYLIYLITITISFSLILAFSLVAGSDAVIRLSLGMDSFKTVLTFINVIIVFVVCFLINYTTKFMFEKRSREFGTYMLLGIKKSAIAKIFAAENVLLGLASLIFAIPSGFILSQFISLVIVRLLDVPNVIFITLTCNAIVSLLFYFIVIYVLVLLNMLLKIRKMTIQSFLEFDRQNEKKMFKSSRRRNIVFVLSLILGILCLLIWYFAFDVTRIDNGNTLTYFVLCMTGLIISLYGISATGADMLLALLLKSKKFKYKGDHLFIARTFASKVRTMSFTCGTLALLILMSLFALNLSGMTKGIYQSSINYNAPYDVSLFDDKESFGEYLAVIDEDYTIKDSMSYDIYKDPSMQIQRFYSQFTDFDSLIKLSDFNRLRQMRGMAPVTLSENEYLIVTDSQKADLVKNNVTLATYAAANGKKLHLTGIDTESFWLTLNSEEGYVAVVPDACTDGLEISESHLIVNTKEETSAALETKIQNRMAHRLCKTDSDGNIDCQYYRIMVRGSAIEEQNTMTAMLASICMYIAFILTSAVGTILAIQSLSDAAKYKYRYITLRRLGVNEHSLYRTIRHQLAVLFGLPVICPFIICFFMVTAINRVYRLLLGGPLTYLIYFAGSMAIFLLIYAIYLTAAYIGFKRNISEES